MKMKTKYKLNTKKHNNHESREEEWTILMGEREEPEEKQY